MNRASWCCLFVFAIMLSPQIVAADLEDGIAMEDVHTHSNFNYVAVKHMSLNLTLDMNQKQFTGYVDLAIKQIAQENQLVLDSKHLTIKSAEISDGGDFKSADVSVLSSDEVRGDALAISIEPSTTLVRVHYATTEKSNGIDWIEPRLTADNFPMVVTQFQAINARTFVPCQDTPGQKITYDATIKLVSDVEDPRMRVVMAAMERESLGDRTFRFAMTKPIPTYLIALAAGVFEQEVISDRVSVIAEPSMAKKARDEFADAEDMVAAAEELLGTYAWGRFDIFIMPPSFSYGGMENPTMTFIGPTVVAGDQSLVDVIAHELAHSWSGNWVTNKNWNEFWLNEGTTMYIERLIVARVYNEELRDLDIVLGQQVLRDNMEEISADPNQGPPLTRLKLDLDAAFDPDDAVSHVPYEKGFNFWLALEQAYGQPAVVDFLKDYFSKHEMGIIDTETIIKRIVAFPAFEGATRVNLDDWLYGEGLPEGGLPNVKSALIDQVDQVVTAMQRPHFSVATITESAREFDTKQWSYFLRKAKRAPVEVVHELNAKFNLSDKNDEVRSNFYVFAIRSGAYKTYSEAINNYLSGVGRIKYVAPIYEALRDAGLKEVALSLYEAHRHHNNRITNGSIERRLR